MKNRLAEYFARADEEVRRISLDAYECLRCDCVHYEDQDVYQEHVAHTSDEGMYEVTIDNRLTAIFGSVPEKR
jgi:hypothetical protein